MRCLFLVALVLCACNGEDKPGPAPPHGTGSVISVGSSVSSAGSSGTYGSSDGGSSGGSGGGSGDSSSSGGSTCMMDGEACTDDGVCIELENGFACGHGMPGDACVLPGDCASSYCVPQPTELDAPGICTGNACDTVMAECEVDGTCLMLSDETLRCSHGEVGEPCITDADCDGARCQQYPGDVLVCAAP